MSTQRKPTAAEHEATMAALDADDRVTLAANGSWVDAEESTGGDSA